MKKLFVGLMLVAAGAAWGQRDEVPALDWFDPATGVNQGSLTETGEVVGKKLTITGLATLDDVAAVKNLGVREALASSGASSGEESSCVQPWRAISSGRRRP